MDRAAREEEDAKYGRGCLALVLCGALVVFLGCLTYLRYIGGYQQSLKAQHWRVTKGVIEEAWLKVTRIEPVRTGPRPSNASASSVYHVELRYAYEVLGVPYVGTRITMGSRSAGGQEIYARFPRGAKVDVFYDPAAPFHSCLIREPAEHSFRVMAVTGLMFLIMTAIFVAIAVRLRRKRR